MNNTIQLYKEFIKRCTDSKNSVENYSDFKRLNDLIKSCIDSNFNGLETCTVSDADKLQTIYDQLLTFQSFELFKDNKSNKDKDFVRIGGGQYHNTLKTFIRFLNAMQLFSANSPSFSKKPSTNNLPLQQIFYGAPGTGKSHEVERITNESNSIRTTFHPDSDYSSFVGAYKPITVEQLKRRLSKDELVYELSKLDAIPGINRTCQLLGFLYWNSFEGMSVADKKEICIKAGHTTKGNPNDTTMNAEIDKGYAVGKANHKLSPQDEKILYKFVPQAFIKAYVEAWKLYSPLASASTNTMTSQNMSTSEDVDQSNDDIDDVKEIERENKNVNEPSINEDIEVDVDNRNTILFGSENPFYLIIEEINRGNCAQIFGDLFQLLDRNNAGYSSYAIIPDTDITKYLESELSVLGIRDVYSDSGKLIAKGYDIKKGLKLVLPPNLHIWATMNTSDQSLFPMDSAFKRRWEWEYVPIKQPTKEDGTLFDWVIQLDGYECSWWDFIEALNQQIFDTTESEDKQLGYFFVKAKDGVIDAKTFVNKVIFYLWNDVFKDEDSDIFKYDEKVWADDDKKKLKESIAELLNKENISFSTFAKDHELLSHYFIDSVLKKAGKGPMSISEIDLEDEESNGSDFDKTKESRKEYWQQFADQYGLKNLKRQNVDKRDKHFLDIKLGFAGLYIANTYLATKNTAAVSLYATDEEIGKSFLQYIKSQMEGIQNELGGQWKDSNKNALFEYISTSDDKTAMAKEMAIKASQFCETFKPLVDEFKKVYNK